MPDGQTTGPQSFHFSPARRSLSQQVADRIQRLIIQATVHPGDKLPAERELARQMQVSRAIVREAIRILAERGLVAAKSGCGTYVTRPDIAESTAGLRLLLQLENSPEAAGELLEARRLLEVEAAALAAQRAAETDVQRLANALAVMEESRDVLEAYIHADLAFHQALAAATANRFFPLLLEPIAVLLEESIRLSHEIPGAVARGLADHHSILQAIRDAHPPAARAAMTRHLDYAYAVIGAGSTRAGGPRRAAPDDGPTATAESGRPTSC